MLRRRIETALLKFGFFSCAFAGGPTTPEKCCNSRECKAYSSRPLHKTASCIFLLNRRVGAVRFEGEVHAWFRCGAQSVTGVKEWHCQKYLAASVRQAPLGQFFTQQVELAAGSQLTGKAASED
jgi:hypothetical protein